MPKVPTAGYSKKSKLPTHNRNHPYTEIEKIETSEYEDRSTSDSSSDCSSNYYQLVQAGRIELDLEVRTMQDTTISVIHTLTGISVYFLEMACNAVLMQYAVRAMYYSLKNDPVNRRIWVERSTSEFNIQMQNPSVPNLFGTVICSLCLIKCGDFNSGIPYFSFALTMAKQLGINKETGLKSLTSNRQEREDCRNLWWFIHRYDQLLKTINRGFISDEDNGVYLPGTVTTKYETTDIRSLGLEIMSSKKLFTPTVPSQSVYVNRILLARLLGQATKLNDEFKKTQSVDILFSILSLKDSLFLWYRNLPSIFHELPIAEDYDPSIKWSVIDTILQYRFAMIKVLSPAIYVGLEEDYELAIVDPAFTQLHSECEYVAELFQMYLNCNPKFKYTFMFAMNYAFHALIPPILLSKRTNANGVVNTLMDALVALIDTFQLGKPLLALAHKFVEMSNPKEILEEYRKFSFQQYL